MSFQLYSKPIVPPTPTLLKRTTSTSTKNPRGLFICSCGTKFETFIGNVKRGRAKSCGCYNQKVRLTAHNKHDHSNSLENKAASPTYKTWHSMIQRCINPNNDYYKRYGGRGIKVCKRWTLFENFLEDMGERPKGLTIERVDNNGDYCKSNCKWATGKEQARNKKDTSYVIYNNNKMSILDAYELSGSTVEIATVRCRIYRGWSFAKAIFVPSLIKRK